MEIKEEIKFKMPEIRLSISTPASVIIGAAIIAGAILYTDSPLNFRLRGYDVNNTSNPSPSVGQPNPSQVGGEIPVVADVTAGNLPFLGDANAPVEVVEWADFQCPFCGKFYSEVEDQIIKDYVNTGKVKFAYRDFAFLGDESKWAANAARCANDQGKFWQYHDYLFNNQNGENQGAFSKENLKKFAATLGLNTSKFNSCVDADTHATEVEADVQAGQSVGVNGTPATFVNGKLLSGAQPYDQFKQAIEAALAGN